MNGHSWQYRVLTALLLLILIAVGARFMWEVLSPMLPTLIALSIVVGLVWLFFRRR